MDAVIRLNKATQKKVLEFQRKFRENPESAAIHLETIATFKDPSLRTARIDQKYRIIIKVVNGDSFYMMWVDNHDEAMDWARTKRFDWNEATNAMQVFSSEQVVEREQQHYEVNHPTSKLLLEQYSESQLVAIGVPTSLVKTVRRVGGYEALEALEKHLPPEAFENLFYLLDGESIDRIIEDVKEGAALDNDTSSNNGRSFVEIFDDQLLESALDGSFEKWRHFLHPSQRALVTGHYKGSVKVSGGAGTGKTVAALHRLKHLVDTKADPRPVLFTTYTKALTSNLLSLTESLGISNSQAKVTNFDKLAFDLAKSTGLRKAGDKVSFPNVKYFQELWDEVVEAHATPYGSEWFREEYEDVVLFHDVTTLDAYLRVPRAGRGRAIGRRMREQVWQVIEAFRERKQGHWYTHELYNALARHFNDADRRPFSHAVVDELQDLSNVELRLLRSLVDEGPNDLMLVGDPMQSIYSRKINFSKAGIYIRGKRSKRLRINYRTTEEIKRVAMSVVQGVQFDDFDGGEESKKGYVSLMRGERPVYRIFGRKQEELDFIVAEVTELLKSGAARASEIAIGCRVNSGLSEIISACHSAGIPYYSISDGTRKGDKFGVGILTLHNLKGLEFKHVLLAQVNDETAPKSYFGPTVESDPDLKADAIKAERSLHYVAASRAIATLTISGYGKPSEWFSGLLVLGS